MFGFLGGFEILLVLLLLPFMLAAFVFWFWMLIDCAVKEPSDTQKIVWVLIILFTHFVGALIYLFVRKIPRGRGMA